MITIDIDGEQGNAYALIGIGRCLARQMGLNAEEISEEMSSNDYLTVLETFQKYFHRVARLTSKDGLKNTMDYYRKLRKIDTKIENDFIGIE